MDMQQLRSIPAGENTSRLLPGRFLPKTKYKNEFTDSSESQMTKEMPTRKESEWWTQHVQAEVGPKEDGDTRKVAANKPCAAQNCQTPHGETGLHGSVEVHSAGENLWRCQEN